MNAVCNRRVPGRMHSGQDQLPVLSCILLEQEYGALRLKATDLDHFATVTLAAQTPSDDTEPLRVCVPVQDFYKMVNALPKESAQTKRVRLAIEAVRVTGENETDGLFMPLRMLN